MRVAFLLICASLGSWILPSGAHAERQASLMRALSCRINTSAPARSANNSRSLAAARRPGRQPWSPDEREMREFGRGAIINGRDINQRRITQRRNTQRRTTKPGGMEPGAMDPDVTARDPRYRVAFTFDDGPDYLTTPRVLDALDRYHVPATFFVVGWRFANKHGRHTAENRAVLGNIVSRGYHIGNHTFHHRKLSEIPAADMKDEIDKNARALAEQLGYTPRTFRPPYGATNPETRAHLRAHGLTEVRWSIDVQDFQARREADLRQRTVQAIIEQRGGVVLLHDTKEVTSHAIAGILDDLERENCRRLNAHEHVIVPVSLHYFMKNRDGSRRPVPAREVARTSAYLHGLPARCRARTRSARQ